MHSSKSLTDRANVGRSFQNLQKFRNLRFPICRVKFLCRGQKGPRVATKNPQRRERRRSLRKIRKSYIHVYSFSYSRYVKASEACSIVPERSSQNKKRRAVPKNGKAMRGTFARSVGEGYSLSNFRENVFVERRSIQKGDRKLRKRKLKKKMKGKKEGKNALCFDGARAPAKKARPFGLISFR